MSLSPSFRPFHFPWVVLRFEMPQAFCLAKSECLNFIIRFGSSGIGFLGQLEGGNITLQSLRMNIEPWPGYTGPEQKKHFSILIFLRFLSF
jgi:hypothetical protein